MTLFCLSRIPRFLELRKEVAVALTSLIFNRINQEYLGIALISSPFSSLAIFLSSATSHWEEPLTVDGALGMLLTEFRNYSSLISYETVLEAFADTTAP